MTLTEDLFNFFGKIALGVEEKEFDQILNRTKRRRERKRIRISTPII